MPGFEGHVEILKRSKLTTVKHYALRCSSSERHPSVYICEIQSSRNQEIRIWRWFHKSLQNLSAGMRQSASTLERFASLDRLRIWLAHASLQGEPQINTEDKP
jgi:hypothetical protein